MDITVMPRADNKVWDLRDLLGRSMGHVSEDDTGKFTVYPDGHAAETMAKLPAGPYVSLNDALLKIETLTRGVCRLAKANNTLG